MFITPNQGKSYKVTGRSTNLIVRGKASKFKIRVIDDFNSNKSSLNCSFLKKSLKNRFELIDDLDLYISGELIVNNK
jgi:uncharacterized protein (DUF488 family)